MRNAVCKGCGAAIVASMSRYKYQRRNKIERTYRDQMQALSVLRGAGERDRNNSGHDNDRLLKL